MNKNKPLTFEEWAKTYNFVGFGSGDEEMKIAHDAWNACKAQVEKIVDSPRCYCDYDSGRIIEELNKI